MLIFERPGPANTDAVIEQMKTVSSEFKTIVVASITGDSAIRAARRISDKKVICITCPQGMNWQVDHMQTGPFAVIAELKQIRDAWVKAGQKQVPMQITPENRTQLEALGVGIVQGTIPLFGPTFSMRLHLQHITSLDIMAKTLELISTGTLVCLECVLMAVDAGLIPEGQQVLAAAGTERGLDTAWIVQSCASANVFHPSKGFRFVRLLAKPALPMVPDINIDYLR